MTIKRAKELAKGILGRLPRAGREVKVEETIEEHTITLDWNGRKATGMCKVKRYLVNEGGKFRVYEYWDSNHLIPLAR